MTRKRMIYLGCALMVIAVVYFGWKLTSRSAYESAAYTVMTWDPPFEIREYPDLFMATTSMRFESRGEDGSFMRLFRYISGENEDQQKVAMTTPVFMEPESQDQPGQMGFVLPKSVAEQHVPKPANDGVQIQKRLGGRFAVIRSAGQMDKESTIQAEEKLRKWMSDKGLTTRQMPKLPATILPGRQDHCAAMKSSFG